MQLLNHVAPFRMSSNCYFPVSATTADEEKDVLQHVIRSAHTVVGVSQR